MLNKRPLDSSATKVSYGKAPRCGLRPFSCTFQLLPRLYLFHIHKTKTGPIAYTSKIGQRQTRYLHVTGTAELTFALQFLPSFSYPLDLVATISAQSQFLRPFKRLNTLWDTIETFIPITNMECCPIHTNGIQWTDLD